MLQPSLLNCFRLHDRDTAVHACNADTYPATRTLRQPRESPAPIPYKLHVRSTRAIASHCIAQIIYNLYSIVECDGKGMQRGAGRGPCWRGSTECQMFCVYSSLKVNSSLRIVHNGRSRSVRNSPKYSRLPSQYHNINIWNIQAGITLILD
jgi:hypothetical protein